MLNEEAQIFPKSGSGAKAQIFPKSGSRVEAQDLTQLGSFIWVNIWRKIDPRKIDSDTC